MIHISHPTVESLLGRHGNTPEGRATARAELDTVIRTLAAEAVDRFVRQAGLSLRCRTADHRRMVDGQLDGCGNEGTGCICQCHDGQVAPGDKEDNR